MLFRHMLLGLLVVIIWGCNFTMIKIALRDIEPLTLCALRFVVTSLFVFFLPRPKVSWSHLWWYGFFIFIMQFVFLFLAMKDGISAGLASLVLQSQVIFTMLLAFLVLKEKPTSIQLLGASIALAGLVLIGAHRNADITLWGFCLVLVSAASWAYGNLIIKKLGRVPMLPVVVWSGFLVMLPLTLLALVCQGVQNTWQDVQHLTWSSSAALLYISVLSTLVGYGVWNKLLERYPLISVAPFALLVPVVGMLSSAFILHESLTSWKLMACLMIILGLAIHIMGSRLVRMQRVHK